MSTVAIPAVPELAGPRVRLRALGAGDVDALFALHSDPEVMRYWSYPPWRERAEAEAHVVRIARERESTETYPWATTLHGDDTLIGTVTLFGIHREHLRAVLGYALARRHQGRGLASEAVGLAIAFAFGPLGLERIEADIDPDNVASCRLVERAGFLREGYLRERWRVGGGVQDTALYGLLRRDWIARRS
ncbi:MAG: GNAT family protein [Lysobacterales bacterium]